MKRNVQPRGRRASVSKDPDTPLRVVFLCGFPSSGTDLLKNIVNAHSRVVIGGESPLLPSLASKYSAVVERQRFPKLLSDLLRIDIYKNFTNRDFPADVYSSQKHRFADLYASLLTTQPADWVGNKTPQNSERIRELSHLFPDARFLLIVRDIRDVAMSWKKKWGKSMLLCAHKWNARMLRCLHDLESIGEQRYLILKYEDLLRETEEVGREICDFLEIEFEANLLSFHESVEDIVPGKINYGKPIISENFEKWRHSLTPNEIRRIEQISFPAMSRFGYSRSHATEAVSITWSERFLGRLQDLWAMAFVGNRALGQRQILYRLRSIRLELMKRL